MENERRKLFLKLIVEVYCEIIKKQQQIVPQFETGGLVLGSVNEEGDKIITLPNTSQVIPHDISRKIAAGLGVPND